MITRQNHKIIKDVVADSVKTQHLEASNIHDGYIRNRNITSSRANNSFEHIESVSCVNSSIENLSVAKANVDILVTRDAEINQIKAPIANIAQVSATTIETTTLSAKVLKVDKKFTLPSIDVPIDEEEYVEPGSIYYNSMDENLYMSNREGLVKISRCVTKIVDIPNYIFKDRYRPNVALNTFEITRTQMKVTEGDTLSVDVISNIVNTQGHEDIQLFHAKLSKSAQTLATSFLLTAMNFSAKLTMVILIHNADSVAQEILSQRESRINLHSVFDANFETTYINRLSCIIPPDVNNVLIQLQAFIQIDTTYMDLHFGESMIVPLILNSIDSSENKIRNVSQYIDWIYNMGGYPKLKDTQMIIKRNT